MMEKLTQAAAFVWQYYGIYAWVGITGLTTVLACRRLAVLRRCSVGQKAVLYPLFAVLCCIVSRAALDAALPLPLKLVAAVAVTMGGVCALAALAARGSALCTAVVREHRWGLAVFAVLTVLFAAQSPLHYPIDEYTQGWYAVDYSLGLGSRFFIGNLLKLFYRDFLPRELAYGFMAASMLALFFCSAALIDRFMQRAAPPVRGGAGFLLLCFLACPGSLSALWAMDQQGRLETYTLLLCLAAVPAFRSLRSVPARYLLLAAVCCVNNAIYQGWIFLYFPLVLMLMIADTAQAPQPLRRLPAAAGVCAAAGASFLFFQFGTAVHAATAEELTAQVQERTDLVVHTGPFYNDIYSNVVNSYRDLNIDFLQSQFPREKMVLTLVLLLPLVVPLTALWLKCFALVRAAGKRLWCTPGPWFLLVLLCALPQYLLNVDWGRWTTAVIIDIVFGTLYLAFAGSAEMDDALAALGRRVERQRFAAGLIVLYLASLDRFHAAALPAEAGTLWERLRSLLP